MLAGNVTSPTEPTDALVNFNTQKVYGEAGATNVNVVPLAEGAVYTATESAEKSMVGVEPL